MRDKRIDKIKKHYFIYINNEKFKILNHRIDVERSLFVVKTKIAGQKFPHSNHISISITSDTVQIFTVAFRGMYKDEKIETWEYTILS